MWSDKAAPVRKCLLTSHLLNLDPRLIQSASFPLARNISRSLKSKARCLFSPKRRLFPSLALLSRRCGVSPIEGLLSFTSFLHFRSWLPVNAEAHSWSECCRHLLHGPSDYNPASWKAAVVCRRGTCQRSPGRLPPLQPLTISMLRKSKE